MSYGDLNKTQTKIVQKYVKDREVFDLGAGDLGFSKTLRNFGATQVVAIDKMGDFAPKFLPAWLSFIQASFLDVSVPDKIDEAFLSWPINQESCVISLLPLLKVSTVVIYFGTNLNGTSCGTPTLFSYLRTGNF